MEDQLLGFALVPLSEVLIKNGKLENEFSLSSTDLFHSPAGFVKLSISYSGTSPEVVVLPAPVAETANTVIQDSEVTELISSEFSKIEFPDPKIVNQNHIMVSEYFGMSCTNLDSHSQSSESLLSSDTEIGLRAIKDFSAGSVESIQPQQHDSPPSSVSTNESSQTSLPASSQSSDTSAPSKSPNQECILPPRENPKEKREDVGDAESNASDRVPGDPISKPIVTVNIEPEQKVVQQDIVDMYMKSMQQFTESLAKMKLPMDIANETTSSSENSSSDQKSEATTNSGSRVFYGSRAFF